MNLDAETALRLANSTFEARYREMELATPDLSVLSAGEKEASWQAAKSRLAAQREAKRDQSSGDIRTVTDTVPSSPSARSDTSPRS